MFDIDTLRPLDAQAFTWRQLRSAIHSGFVGSQGKLRHPKLVTLTEIIETDAQGRLVDSDGNALFGKLISPKASDTRAQILGGLHQLGVYGRPMLHVLKKFGAWILTRQEVVYHCSVLSRWPAVTHLQTATRTKVPS